MLSFVFCFCSFVVAFDAAAAHTLSSACMCSWPALSLMLALCRVFACNPGRLAWLYFWNDALFPKIPAICCSVPFVRRHHCSHSLPLSVSDIPGSNHCRLCLSVCRPSLFRSLLGTKQQYSDYYTVRLVSHDPSFCCSGLAIEINTTLESS